MVKLPQKINQSSMQVIKTLKALLQNNYSMKDLVDVLNAQEKEPIFNNSVVSKYINTCRVCGMEIPKINNVYYVVKMPFGINFTQEEYDLLKKLQEAATLLSVKNYKIFENFIEKLGRFSNKKLVRIEKTFYQTSFELFERAISKKQKIKLIYKNGDEIICIPIKIVEDGKKTFLNIFYKMQERMIDIERVSAIEMTNDIFVSTFNEQSVIFSLKSPLAERYELRENEVLRKKESNSITISNKGENPEILLSRLLRYDDKCEILTQVHRDMMKQIINDTLKNYGEA